MTDKQEAGVPNMDQNAVELVKIKQNKAKAKSAFTRYRNRLLNLCDEDEDDVDKSVLTEELDRVEAAMDCAMESISVVGAYYESKGQMDELIKTLNESDIVEKEYNEMLKIYRRAMSERSGRQTIPEKDTDKPLNTDMYRQLKRVSIPVFSGDKKQYEFWVTAFKACIDTTDATAEYKFLQLRQYLSGEALKAVEGLGHTATGYEAAKDRLERKYGGKRRKVNKLLDEIHQFPVLRYENVKMVEKYADLIDIAYINLKENSSEIGSEFLYFQLLKKLPESMLNRYQRWVFDLGKTEGIEELRQWMNKEAEFHTISSETKYGLDKQTTVSKEKSYFVKGKNKECGMCKESHGMWECVAFKALPIDARWDKAKELQVCFRCLAPNHLGKYCKFERKCGVNGCKKTHHKLLHRTLNPDAPSYQPIYTNTSNVKGQSIALRTVPVILKNGQKSMKVNALLDDGSTTTYINSDIAVNLGLGGNSHRIQISTVNGKNETYSTTEIQCQLESVNGSISIPIEAKTMSNVTGNLKTIDWNEAGKEWDHLKGLEFPRVGRDKSVDMLIGLDHADLHQSLYEIAGSKGEPIARLTPLGWTCVGPCTNENRNQETSTFFSHTDNINLEKFWEIESVVEEKQLSPIDCQTQEFVESKIHYDSADQRYTVPIPWNENKMKLTDNYEMAEKRLKSTENKLVRESLQGEYNKIVENYVEKGYVVKTEKDDKDNWYLPHFPVIRPEKETTKIRIVFDASAKYKGVCLNDTINQGPKLQNDLFDVITRFRRQKVALMCDVQEMYLQIGIIPSDRKFLKFLWRTDPMNEPEVYQFNRVVFGVNASPFLAQFVSQYNAQKFADEYPMAAESVTLSTYMDDTMDSVENDEKGIELYRQVSELWMKASMFSRKWLSNSEAVMSEIPQKDRTQEIDLTKGELPAAKTLGLWWNAESDCFTFRSKISIDNEHCFTKRLFLSKVSTVYDPLGFISPFVIRAKVTLQEIWLQGLDWDDKLPQDINKKINQWFSEIPTLSKIQIKRNMNYETGNKIHTFVDASSSAYGAVAYTIDKEKVVSFIAAKSHVTPLKTISIPRLELLGAMLGLKLTRTICKALNADIRQVTFWTDSMNVLYWIRNESRSFKTFVANRISAIQSETSPKQWRYVPTKENPADIVTRGSSLNNLQDNTLWWSGPSFLTDSSDIWPLNKFEINDEAKVEKRANQNRDEITFMTLNTKTDSNELDPARFSNFTRLCRLYAWCIRFVENCQLRKEDRRLSKELSVQEINQAETLIIRRAQNEAFSVEYEKLIKKCHIPRNSKLLPLNPYIDNDGIMRSNSRLTNAEYLPVSARFPIVLPRKNSVTRLIVKQYHENVNHSGTNHTLSEISSRFWILSAREEIRDWEQSCAECRRRKAKPAVQIMAPLPDYRVKKSMKPFTNTAVDFAGPFLTKQGRGKSREKRYLCVFTCMECRAVHFEMSYGLDTDSFLNCFYRFVCRRGKPSVVVSDNGTNFVGAARELKQLYEQLDKQKISRNAADKQINWHFIPPNAPHFGGIHEAMVKCAKRALYHVLKESDVNDEELSTSFIGAENLVNSRPLTYQSADPSDTTVLTPNHFLFGQIGGKFAPETVDLTRYDFRKRWRFVQEIVKHVWSRWQKEFLPVIGARKKWFQQTRDFQIGDVVLVVDPSVPRGQWLVGRIEQVYLGRDNHVRVADVRVDKSVLKRPVTRLCLLEPEAR